MARAVRALTIGGVALFGTCVLWACTGVAGGPPDALVRKLSGIPGAERAQLGPLSEERLARVFPRQQFYVLRFRQYPVPQEPPESFGVTTLFVLQPDGAVMQIKDAGALEAFFRAALDPVATEEEARRAVEAWLRLTQEFHQDGHFQFSIPAESLQVTSTGADSYLATGKAAVDPRGGNQGEIVASLTFDRSGRLVKVSQTESVRRGIRPICQATRLLDADPLVRAMAEQEILVMGRAAKAYLDEQRARVRPELQRAIDAIWQRILAEGR